MLFEGDNPLESPHFLQKRKTWKQNSRSPIPTNSTSSRSTGPLPTYSNASAEELKQERNLEIQKECAYYDIPFIYPLRACNTDDAIDKPKVSEWIDQKQSSRANASIISRVNKVTELTLKKITKSLESSSSAQEAEFDYWTFQGSLQQEKIFEENFWLECQLWNKSEQEIQWIPPPAEGISDALLKEFEKMYGPIYEDNDMSNRLLHTFRRSMQESIEISNKRMRIIWGISQAFGPDVALQLIKSRMQDELENLKLSPHHSGFKLMHKKKADGIKSIYHVNPVTNPTHSEWFLLPQRFRDQPGPSSLFIKYPGKEKFFAEYASPPDVTLVEGYWPSLIDLTFTHPIRWCEDPLQMIQEESEESVDKTTTAAAQDEDDKEYNFLEAILGVLDKEKMDQQLQRERQERLNAYEKIHNTLRWEIKKFPMGIALSVYFDKVISKHYVTDWICPGFTYTQFVHALQDVFLTSQLPNTEDLILFPAFLKWILLEGEMPALGIFKRVWNKMVFTVKTSGGKIRSQDLHPLYWKYWSLKIQPVIDAWGFAKIEDFIEWCMRTWNSDGKGEGLLVQTSRGTCSSYPDPFLVYKPAEN